MRSWRSSIHERMTKFSLLVTLCLTIASAYAKQLLPIAEGTTWQYDATEQAGGQNESAIHSVVNRRLSGTQEFDGRKLLKLETFSGGVLSRTELISVDDNEIRCFARSDKGGIITGLPSPQTIVPAKLQANTSWECEGEVADVQMHQHCIVAGAEDISVPAGNFHAFRFYCEQSAPTSIVIDRWFLPGAGFVKERTTMRSPSGDLLGRQTLELTRPPVVTARPGSETPAAAKKLSAGVSSGPVGKFETEFSSSVPNIYARWQGHGLRQQAKVRVVWIAENVGDVAPPNYRVDEATAIAAAPDSRGMFTLSRPENGWAEGNYRVEFYLDTTLIEVVRLRIK
jgi:hypothetical protein